MRIGELAEATGVSARSLRYYESIGRIRSARRAAGWRDFDDATVDRVVTIQHLFAAGLNGRTVAELLPCLEAPPAERTDHLPARLRDEIARLEHARRELDRELDVLRELLADAGAVRPGVHVDGRPGGTACT